jgi:hypothetical protein
MHSKVMSPCLVSVFEVVTAGERCKSRADQTHAGTEVAKLQSRKLSPQLQSCTRRMVLCTPSERIRGLSRKGCTVRFHQDYHYSHCSVHQQDTGQSVSRKPRVCRQ